MLNDSSISFEKLINGLIRLGVLVFLVWWCIDILSPFILILVWGSIIAIAAYPAYQWLLKRLKNKAVLTAVILTIGLLAAVVFPSWFIVDSLLDGINYLKTIYESGGSLIPPPGESTKTWPSFTQPFLDFWKEASSNFGHLMSTHASSVKSLALWLFSAFSGFGTGLLQFIISIIVAGVLFVYSSSIYAASNTVFLKLAGNYGKDFSSVSILTIRNVVKGIIGVAVVQASMAGLGFFIAEIPFAGLWTILCLILAIVQIGAGPVIIPVIIYVFSVHTALSAGLLTVWLVLVMFIDNLIKPILLGRGAPAPMLVIFLGAIGGFISNGFIGLFLGAVILTLGYKLFETWLHNSEEKQPTNEVAEIGKSD